MIDGEKVELAAGDWLRIAPKGQRQFGAATDSEFTFICIQVKAGSSEDFTMNVGIIVK